MEDPTGSFFGLLSATERCGLCRQQIPLIQMLPHTAQCSIRVSLAVGVEPFCTCPSCSGTCTHPGSKRVLPPLNQAAAPPQPTQRYISQRRSSGTPGQAQVEDVSSDDDVGEEEIAAPIFSILQMTAKKCFFCNGNSVMRKDFPVMRIGKYYGVRPCNKRHFPEDMKESVLECLDKIEALDLINQAPDECSEVSLFDDGCPGRPIPGDQISRCGGTGKQPCFRVPSKDPTFVIWDQEKQVYVCFCTSKHMYLWYVNRFGPSGRPRRSSQRTQMQVEGE